MCFFSAIAPMRLAKYELNFEFIEIHYKDIIRNPNNVVYCTPNILLKA